MVQATIFTSEKEEGIINELKKEWSLNKIETILKIIREYYKLIKKKR